MLPAITHLQFLILNSIVGPRSTLRTSGKEIRTKIKKYAKMSGPKFYQIMARLEKSKLITTKYVTSFKKTTKSSKQIVREKHYKLTHKGDNAVCATREFYFDGVNVYQW